MGRTRRSQHQPATARY